MSLENVDILAPLPPIEQGTAYILSNDPRGKNFLYTNGYNVIIRDINNPKKSLLYADHKAGAKPKVAKYSQAGTYICSGDDHGQIKIWEWIDAENEHREKSTFPIFANEVKDIAWDADGKRVAIVGRTGDSVKAKVIMWDSGNSLGNISGLSKCGNSVDIKKTRPYRMVVIDEEGLVQFCEGPPFKAKDSLNEHNGRFGNCVRFSPDGSRFVSVASDGNVHMYDGKTSDKIGSFADVKNKAHAGGVYCVSWSKDGKELITASGDKTCKIWNAETRELVVTFTMGSTTKDQVYSCLWQEDHIIAVTGSGDMFYLDRENPSEYKRVIRGHTLAVWGVAAISSQQNCLYSCDAAGKIVRWNMETGDAEYVKGNGHKSKIHGIAYDAASDQIISIGLDDNIRYTNVSTNEYVSSMSLGSQPISLCLLDNSFVAVLMNDQVIIVKDGKKVSSVELDSDEDVQYIAGHGSTLVVETQKASFTVFDMSSSGTLTERETVNAVVKAGPYAFSNCGGQLAVAQQDKTIRMYTIADGFDTYKQYSGQDMRVSALAFSPNGDYLTSTGIDNSLIVWRVGKPQQREKYTRAHMKSHINCLAWLDNATIVTGGNDAVIKTWKVEDL